VTDPTLTLRQLDRELAALAREDTQIDDDATEPFVCWRCHTVEWVTLAELPEAEARYAQCAKTLAPMGAERERDGKR
jgi:hypothetical protein